ncbi:MAG: 4-hydroxythreonine-4-phosphate dehydrogenase PdxA [Aureispira sp.]|nr:4-hydroxythreonine-4-phosphate dehydrogenase PdxA [Aureispira sp.]
MNKKIKVGITVGDINGVGLEVVLKTVVNKGILDFCTPIIYGSSKVVSYHKNIVKIKDLPLNSIRNAEQASADSVNVLNCWMDNVRINLGKITEEGGKYAHISLEKATEDLMAGHIDVLVTAPINKKSMQLVNFPYPGHTEYLTDRFGGKRSLMLMVHEDLRIGLACNHVPIKDVASHITKENVLDKLDILHHTLKMDFGIDKPKIAVLGLNPHAGDEGALGEEETTEIIPAIAAAKEKGILALGPYPADGFFGASSHKGFDAVLAMYHDQGLVAFKTLAFGGGINYTAGLPHIRTSPDHGTAYNIVGQNSAQPDSFRQALFLAIDAVKQRHRYMDMTSNPLKEISLEEFDEANKNSNPKSSRDKSRDKRERPKREDVKRGKPQKKEQTPPPTNKEEPKKESPAKTEEAPKKEEPIAEVKEAPVVEHQPVVEKKEEQQDEPKVEQQDDESRVEKKEEPIKVDSESTTPEVKDKEE